VTYRNGSSSAVVGLPLAPRKKSLLPIWICGIYCVATGAWQLGQLAAALYNARDMVSWLLPPWLYVVAFVLPVARVAAGISFIRKFKHSPIFLLALTVYRGVFPVVWYYFWVSQTGKRVPGGPLPIGAIADLFLLAAITVYAFVLKRRGALS
jgi:hypothetical protein